MQQTKADEIAVVLEEGILKGEYPPGLILRQDQLSAQLGVSRTPIREALRMLAASGLVSIVPNRGARVRGVSPDSFREALQIRAELEGLAAELAATAITPGQLAELEDAQERFRDYSTRMIDAGEDRRSAKALSGEWVRANDDFHNVILEAGAGPLLTEMARSVRYVLRGEFVAQNAAQMHDTYVASVAQHDAIITALRGRSPAGSRALMKDHIMASLEIAQNVFLQLNGRPVDGAADGD